MNDNHPIAFRNLRLILFFLQNSPGSPTIEFDSTFSRLLMEKRNQKNESTLNQKTLDCTSGVNEAQSTCSAAEPETQHEEPNLPKIRPSLMENSMRISGNTSTDLDEVADDSFLEIERQCLFEEQRQRMLEAEADNTILSDIEPPPELWEDSLIAQVPSVQQLRTNDDIIHLSPMRMVGAMRQSTIVEETSSQCNSTGENSQNSTKPDAAGNSKKSLSSSSSSSDSTIFLSSTENSMIEKISPLKLVEEVSPSECIPPTSSEVRRKRDTFVFKKRKYKFFKDENEQTAPLVVIDSPKTPAIQTKDLISLEKSPCIVSGTPSRDQFNDTIEAVEFFMEKGKQLLERTPQMKSGANRTMLETPLFSCKRSRILSEMAAAEMLPIPKRGPLIDLYSSPDTPATPNARK